MYAYMAHWGRVTLHGYGYPRFHVALLQQSSGQMYLDLQSQRQDFLEASILTQYTYMQLYIFIYVVIREVYFKELLGFCLKNTFVTVQWWVNFGEM